MPNEKDMLIEAYRIQVERWNKRRDIEWRLTLTLWSTILITTFALTGKYQYPWCIGIIHLTLFGIYCFWICNLWRRNACDKKQMYNYQKKINEKLSICSNDVSEEGWYEARFNVPQWHHYLAYDGDEPVNPKTKSSNHAVAAMYIQDTREPIIEAQQLSSVTVIYSLFAKVFLSLLRFFG